MKKKILLYFLFIIAFLLLSVAYFRLSYNETARKKLTENVLGSWSYENDEGYVENIFEKVYFGKDGTFLSMTWRGKKVGTYKVRNDKIIVNYDLYFKLQGTREYDYYWSGERHFVLDDDKLTITLDKINNGTVFDNHNEFKKTTESDLFEKDFYKDIVMKK